MGNKNAAKKAARKARFEEAAVAVEAGKAPAQKEPAPETEKKQTEDGGDSDAYLSAEATGRPREAGTVRNL